MCTVNVLISTSWSSGYALLSAAGGLKFKSDTLLPTLATAATFFRKELCLKYRYKIMFLHCKFLCHLFNSINFYLNRPRIKLFLPKKYKIFERWGLYPQTAVTAPPLPLQISSYTPVYTDM